MKLTVSYYRQIFSHRIGLPLQPLGTPAGGVLAIARAQLAWCADEEAADTEQAATEQAAAEQAAAAK